MVIIIGNFDLFYVKVINYDFFFVVYKGGWGLFLVGVFYKDVENIFYFWIINFFDQEIVDVFGYLDNWGYEFCLYVNLLELSVYGYELELQVNLMFLFQFFNGIVFNVNYLWLYLQIEVFFLMFEICLVILVLFVFEIMYINFSCEVNMLSQVLYILWFLLGYDYKGFLVRVLGVYQGEKVENYSVNKDFDIFIVDFWCWDVFCK